MQRAGIHLWTLDEQRTLITLPFPILNLNDLSVVALLSKTYSGGEEGREEVRE